MDRWWRRETLNVFEAEEQRDRRDDLIRLVRNSTKAQLVPLANLLENKEIQKVVR